MKPFSGMTKDNTALLIVDVINSCCSEKCEIPEWSFHFTKIRGMVPQLSQFIGEFREQVGGLVIFGKTVPWRAEFLANNVNELYENERFAYYTKDTSGFAEEFYSIKPQDGDVVLDKKSNDAFVNPQLSEKLKVRGIKYVAVSGVLPMGVSLPPS